MFFFNFFVLFYFLHTTKQANQPRRPRQWRSFDFFDAAQIRIADDDTRALLEGSDVTSVCSGSDSLFLGSRDGHVHIVGPSWKVVRSFRAYDTGPITHMRQVEGTSLLVTVAVGARWGRICLVISSILGSGCDERERGSGCAVDRPRLTGERIDRKSPAPATRSTSPS